MAAGVEEVGVGVAVRVVPAATDGDDAEGEGCGRGWAAVQAVSTETLTTAASNRDLMRSQGRPS